MSENVDSTSLSSNPEALSSNPQALSGNPHARQSGDARVTNNVMRHEYRVLSDAEKHAMKTIKDMGLEFYLTCDAIGGSRELSIAKTKAEEAVMWAVKHITK